MALYIVGRLSFGWRVFFLFGRWCGIYLYSYILSLVSVYTFFTYKLWVVMVFDLPTVLTWRMVLFPTNNVYLKYSISLGLEVNLIFYLIFQLCLFEIRPPSPVASRTPPAHLARSSTTPTQSSMLRRDGSVCVRRSSQKALWTKCKKKTVGFCEGLEITWCFGLISPSYICETRFFVVDSKTFLFFVYFFLSCVFGGVEGEREREKRKLPLTPVFRGQTAFRGITAPPPVVFMR